MLVLIRHCIQAKCTNTTWEGRGKTKQNATPQAQNLLFTFHLCCTLFLWSLTGLWILTEDQSPNRHNFQPLTKYLTSFLNASFSSTHQNPSASVYKSLLASEQFLDLQHTLSTRVCQDRRSVAVCDLPSLQLTFSPKSHQSIPMYRPNAAAAFLLLKSHFHVLSHLITNSRLDVHF